MLREGPWPPWTPLATCLTKRDIIDVLLYASDVAENDTMLTYARMRSFLLN